jgi:hypothetical protein
LEKAAASEHCCFACALQAGDGLANAEALIEKMLQAEIVIATAPYLSYAVKGGDAPRLLAAKRYNERHPDDPLFDLLVFDEAHHTPAKSWIKVKEAMAGAPRRTHEAPTAAGSMRCRYLFMLPCPCPAAADKKTKILHTTATPFRSDNQKIEYDRAVPSVSLIDGLIDTSAAAAAGAKYEQYVKDVCFLELKSTKGDAEVCQQMPGMQIAYCPATQEITGLMRAGRGRGQQGRRGGRQVSVARPRHPDHVQSDRVPAGGDARQRPAAQGAGGHGPRSWRQQQQAAAGGEADEPEGELLLRE